MGTKIDGTSCLLNHEDLTRFDSSKVEDFNFTVCLSGKKRKPRVRKFNCITHKKNLCNFFGQRVFRLGGEDVWKKVSYILSKESDDVFKTIQMLSKIIYTLITIGQTLLLIEFSSVSI